MRIEHLESRNMLAVLLSGDYDGSGAVDGLDYHTWKDSFGQTVQVAGQGADGNHDGIIDASDFTVWRDNLGRTSVAEKLVFGDGSFVPLRAATSENGLIVPAGETVTLAPESNYDHIEVFGTLRVSRDYDTSLSFVDLIVHHGGTLDMGTADDPVLCNVHFVVKDRPIDLAVDPYQLGNGIINLGTWHAYGRELTEAWATLTEELHAGDTRIGLAFEPTGWEVGDELLIPDTAQIAGSVNTEATVRLAAIDGNTVTLDRPLDFNHLAVRDPDGNIRLMPYVANITRNIVIRSENPEGTRGHTINLMQAESDVRYVSFLGLGRTLAETLNNAVVNPDGSVTPGTNQVARYAWHWHHVHSSHDAPADHPHSGHLVGNYFDGSDIGKWGIVIHGTSDMHVADNITNRFVGAGIVTEDGNEYRNVIEGNFATGSYGNAGGLDSKFAAVKNNPGGEGAGFWFHSIENTIRDNVSVNNNIGYVSLNMLYPKSLKASQAGNTAIEFSGNVALSNLRHGLETWRSELDTVYDGLVSANNGVAQFFFGSAEIGSATIRNSLFLAQGGVTWGIQATTYGTGLRMVDTEVLGAATGIGTFSDLYEITNSTFQNRVNFDWTPRIRQELPLTTLDGVRSLALPGEEVTHFLLGEYTSHLANFHFRDNVGYKILLKNWQQSGTNYILYRPHSAPEVLIEVDGTQGYLPPGGPITNAEAWANYGIALDGGVIPDNAIPLVNSDGYVVEFAGDKPELDLGVARLTQVYPFNYTPNVSGTKKLRLYFRYTGNPADLNAEFTIDGITVTNRSVKIDEASRTVFVELFVRDGHNNSWAEPGEHTLSTWRTLDGEQVAGSELGFTYTSL